MKKAIVASTLVAATAVLARRYGPTLKRRGMAKCQRMMARHVQHLTAAPSDTENGGVVMACKPGNGGGACCSTETKKPAPSTSG